MKRLVFLTVAAASLTLGACNRGNEDAVNNAELNQPESDLNEIANQAALDAANEAAAAQNAMQQSANEQNAVVENVVNPAEADEQNVSGMLSWAVEPLIADGRGVSDTVQGVTLEVFGEGDSMGARDDTLIDFAHGLVERLSETTSA